ncbi:MAG: LLM class flavin-dependent oxidoreductase [Gammaproteobacteria bacterium]|nr:LLM class flavin-dependent oxidoreductase [Gammaproteobacteria bacterium]
MELWTLTHSRPSNALNVARRAEAAGWHGMLVVDSQNLAADSYVGLAVAAAGTQSIGLGTGVTNTVTRHPAVTASAAMAVQDVSGGRMFLGIGRGDSALAHLGRSPARFAGFERYIQVLQRYLRGEAVPFDEIPMADDIAAPIADLELADHPDASRIRWFKTEVAKVPVEVAATGPRVIAMAGRLADRVMFTLGAVEERLQWGIDTAQSARRSAGLSGEVALGAYVNLVCHEDRATARDLVRGGLTTFARFSVMHGSVAGPADAAEQAVFNSLHDGYDMKSHTRADSRQAALLDDAFVDRHAIVGPPDYCIERLEELGQLGLDKIAISGPTAGTDPREARRAMALLDEAVIPHFSGNA